MKTSEKRKKPPSSFFIQQLSDLLYSNPTELGIYPYHISLHTQKPQGVDLKYYRFDHNPKLPFHPSWNCVSPSITSTKIHGDDFWLDCNLAYNHELNHYPNHDPFPYELNQHFYTHEIELNESKVLLEETKDLLLQLNSDKSARHASKVHNSKQKRSSTPDKYASKVSKVSKNIALPINIYYPCRFCEEIFDNKQDFRAHIKNHSMQSPYSCIVCNKDFNRKDALIKHWMSLTCIKKFNEWKNSTNIIQLDKLK